MPGIIGSWGYPDLEIERVGARLAHVPGTSVRAIRAESGIALAHVHRRPHVATAPYRGAGDLCVVVDGEIYGCGGRTNPDQEESARFLSELYLSDPEGAVLGDINGLFSAALYDPARSKLFLLSDPLGSKPLYFHRREGAVLFSSEIKVFPDAVRSLRAIDSTACTHFLETGKAPVRSTWLRDVERVLPGHCLAFDLTSGVVSDRCIARLDVSRDRYGSFEEAKKHISEELRHAVGDLSRGNGEVAVELSGDGASRLVLAEIGRTNVRHLTYTFGDDDSEDVAYARAVSQVSRAPNYAVPLNAPNWFANRVALSWLADGPNLFDIPPTNAVVSSLQRTPDLALAATLGPILLGAEGLRGLQDGRIPAILDHVANSLAPSLRVWDNLLTIRAPFADRRLMHACLSVDVAYLMDHRMVCELGLTEHGAHFGDIPLRERGGRLASDVGAKGTPTRPWLRDTPADYHAWLRGEESTRRFIRDMLSSPDALYREFADGMGPINELTPLFQQRDAAKQATFMRLISLEVWLRQLIRGELRAPPSAPDRSARSAPAVSVIVPAYNVEDYIGECLGSLVSQQMRDIEIIVVNDGSTDGTRAIIQRYADADPRIIPVDIDNGGVYRARNEALAVARGEFVSFVDSDDRVRYEMLSSLHAAAVSHDADVTFCDVNQFSGWGAPRVRGNTLGLPPDIPLNIRSHPEMIADGFTTLWNRLYRRDFVERNRLRFEERFRISADMLFLQRVLSHAKCIVRVPRALYDYRFATPKGLTSYQVRNEQYRTHLEITIELIDYWVREGLFEAYAGPILTKAVRNFLWNTHIDVEKLKHVFNELHQYVTKLELPGGQIRGLSGLERSTLACLRSGDFDTFLRRTRGYRTRMIKGKGGVLSPLDRRLDSAKSALRALRDSAALKVDHNRRRSRYSVSALGMSMTVDYSALQSRAALLRGLDRALQEASPGLPISRFAAAFGGTRNDLRTSSDVAEALSRKKQESEIRVLHLSRGFSVPSETFTYDVVCGLERLREIDNYVMCFRRELVAERPFSKVIEIHGLGRPDLESGSAAMQRGLDLTLGTVRPDLVHCHFGWVGLPLVRLLRARGVSPPVVITMHGTDVNMWPRQHAWYLDELKRLADAPHVHLTTHTETYRRKLLALGVPGAQISVIPNSVNPRFAQEGSESAMGANRTGVLRIISVARMDVWKGHEYLIRGFALFRHQTGASATLTLVGYGPEEAGLRGLVSDLDIEPYVSFRGRVAHHDVPVLLRHHDVYVQPSIKHPTTLQEEGQPIAVLEAIAMGMRVIVTDTGGMAETVRVGQHSNRARVVHEKSAAAIAVALGEVHGSPDVPAEREAYRRAILAKHAHQSQVDATAKLYATMLGRGDRDRLSPHVETCNPLKPSRLEDLR